jgi:IS30 family transposase
LVLKRLYRLTYFNYFVNTKTGVPNSRHTAPLWSKMIVTKEPKRKMQVLTYVQRQWIEFFNNKGQGPRQISRQIKRDHTVISRELKRNTKPGKKYSAITAQKLADFKAKKTNKRKLDKDRDLHDYVVKKIKEGFSPDEVAGELKNFAPNNLIGKTISYEAIYDYIYNGEGKWESLYQHLRKKHRKRKIQHGRKSHKMLIPERVSIHSRPEAINLRQRTGDWETDSMKFKKQKASLSVQYERKLMLTRIHKVKDGTAEETQIAISKSIESLPMELFKSITWDNGSEGVCHAKIRDGYNIDTYFCDPYASWQKGGVENLNGLIREYLPRETDMTTITDEDIYLIQEKLNNRPRKKLGYLTPNKALAAITNQLTGALNS